MKEIENGIVEVKLVPTTSEGFTYLLGSIEELRSGEGTLLSGGLDEARDEIYSGGIIGVYQNSRFKGPEKSFDGFWHPHLIHISGTERPSDLDDRIATSLINSKMPNFNHKSVGEGALDVINISNLEITFSRTEKILKFLRAEFGLTFDEECVYQGCKNN